MKKYKTNKIININIGDTAQINKTINEFDINMYSRITGDNNPIHLDQEYAKKTQFKGRIAHGLLCAGLISAVLGTKLPGPGAIYLSQELKFLHPVYIGDTITAQVKVTDLNPIKKIIKLVTWCFNQNSKEVIIGKAILLMESIEDGEK